MMEKGLLKEVELLLKKGYTKDLVSMQAIGYKELIPYFSQQISLEQAIYDLKKNTRHFAKRQLTWFKTVVNWMPEHAEVVLPGINKPEGDKMSRGKDFIYKRMKENL